MVEIHPAGYRVEIGEGGIFMRFSIVSINFFNAGSPRKNLILSI
jgi:hypothetical protein